MTKDITEQDYMAIIESSERRIDELENKLNEWLSGSYLINKTLSNKPYITKPVMLLAELCAATRVLLTKYQNKVFCLKCREHISLSYYIDHKTDTHIDCGGEFI